MRWWSASRSTAAWWSTRWSGAGYRVYGVNPLAVSRYRERHTTSGAKSDAADAKLLADLVRTDRHNHRPLAGDSDAGERDPGARPGPSGPDLDAPAPGERPALGPARLLPGRPCGLRHRSGLGRCAGDPRHRPDARERPARSRAPRSPRALRRGGRERNLERRAAEIQQALRAEQPEGGGSRWPTPSAPASAARVAVLVSLNQQIAALERELGEHFDRHPDAEILRSLAGLGPVLGARVLGEFGDDPNRFADARGRKAYAGTAPITKASGRSLVVLARVARNRRLADACERWAFCSLTAQPGRTALLRRPARPRQDPLPGHPPARQPLGRDPPRLPGAPRGLPRGGRLARASALRLGRLTLPAVGYLGARCLQSPGTSPTSTEVEPGSRSPRTHRDPRLVRRDMGLETPEHLGDHMGSHSDQTPLARPRA